MLIDKNTLKQMLHDAEQSPRKRSYLDLRNDEDEGSQRLLIAVLPSNAKEIIHRHRNTSETLVLLQGNVTIIFYNDAGKEINRFTLNPTTGQHIIQIPKGIFHTLVANAPSVFFESKAGKYEPCMQEDMLTL